MGAIRSYRESFEAWEQTAQALTLERIDVISKRPEMASIAEKHSQRLSYGTGWPGVMPSSSAVPNSSSTVAAAAVAVPVLSVEALALALAGLLAALALSFAFALLSALLAVPEDDDDEVVLVLVLVLVLAFFAAGFRAAKNELTGGAAGWSGCARLRVVWRCVEVCVGECFWGSR